MMLPDDIVLPMTAMEQMVAVRNKLGGSVLLAVEVPREQTFNYGVFDVEPTEDDGVHKVIGMVEKPDSEDAPSNFVATGRYVLVRKIFDALPRITPGKGGDLQLTDAIELLIQEGDPVHVVVHRARVMIWVIRKVISPRMWILICVQRCMAQRCICS